MTADIDSRIAAIWSDDVLGRSDDAAYIQDFLEGRIAERKEAGKTKSYVINLDAGWGHGKTFFIERLAQTLEAKGRIVVRVNAWRDDHADDPLLPLMVGIDAAISGVSNVPGAVKSSWNAAKKAGAAVAIAAAKGTAIHLASKIVGSGAEEIAEILGGGVAGSAGAAAAAAGKEAAELFDKHAEKLLEKFRSDRRSVESFRVRLGETLGKLFAKQRSGPLYILIDELDRCRPSYAISTLERVKHLFDIDNVVFVVATDSQQLQHSIKAVYGNDFDSKRYLFRFFDRTFTFEKPETRSFVEARLIDQPVDQHKISLPPDCLLPEFLARGADHLALGLRDVEQSLDLLSSVVTTWKKPMQLELVLLYPLIILHQQRLTISSKSKLKDHFGQLASNNPHSNPPWRVRFRDRHGKQKFATVVELIERFHILAAPNLAVSYDREHPMDEPDRWVRSRLDNEARAILQNGFDPRNPPVSIIEDYASLVRNAGRISSEASISTRPNED
jgi:hypothetical protein